MVPVAPPAANVCIQGWSQVVSWRGVSLVLVLEQARPQPDARYLLLRTFDDKWEHAREHGCFYGVVDLDFARQGVRDERPAATGPVRREPLRLRLESQLGHKMVKWIRSVELVADYPTIGEGKGGWREDVLYYSQIAPI